MIMILVGHFTLTFGLWNGSDFICRQDVTTPALSYLYVFIYSFCVVGVNIFILISGYFHIHLTWKSFLSYYLLCVFYNALVLLVDILAFDAFSWRALVKVFLVDKTVNWFFRAYFWLMLLSPLLNKALMHFSLQELRITVALLLFLNCFSGFVLQEHNTDGYSVYNFIFLYVLGDWTAKEPVFKRIRRWDSFAFFLGACLLNSCITVLMLSFSDRSIRQVFAYNNPLVVVASVGIVLFFSKLVLNSKTINTIASTVVAALFIQHIFFMLHPSLKTTYSPFFVFGIITPLLFAIAFLIEYPRKRIATKFISYITGTVSNRLIKNNEAFNHHDQLE